uniref:response regulator n=1 Tax=Flavobacterium sp. TaxID=239 RepID=UPI004049276A
MMNNPKSILLIDDHVPIMEAYKVFLEEFFKFEFTIKTVSSLEESYELLFLNNPKINFDVVFLDIGLPPCKKYLIKDGLEIGVLLREHYPNSKIIVITGYDYPTQIKNIINRINPEGLLSKGDVDRALFLKTCQDVFDGKIVRSESI